MKASNWPLTSRHSRGYGTQWDKLRKRILDRDHHLCKCNECKDLNRKYEATEVHHVVSKAKAAELGWSKMEMDMGTNLIAINKSCHRRETALEQGRSIITRGVNNDGWPNNNNN